MLNAAGIERLSGRLLRDRAEILSRSLSEIFNLSIISHRVFPDAFEVAKLKPNYKKGNRQTFPTTDLFLYFQSFLR